MVDDTDYDKKIKLIMIGDSSVGKTTIISRYFEERFNKDQIITTGIGLYQRDIELGNKKIRLQTWDTAGQERYRCLTTNYYKNAQGVVLVFDVTNRESFSNLKQWVDSIYEHCSSNSNIKIVILGNKIDKERKVSKEEAELYCKKLNYAYFEVSAYKNINIDTAFRTLTLDILNLSMNVQTNKNGQLRLTEKDSIELGDSSINNTMKLNDINKPKGTCCLTS